MFQQLVSIFVLVICFIIPDFSYAIDPNGTTMGRLKSSPYYAKLISDVEQGWEGLNTNEQKSLLNFMKRTLTKTDKKLGQMKEETFSKRIAKVAKRSAKADKSALSQSEEGIDYQKHKTLFSKVLSKSSLKDIANDASLIINEDSSRESLSNLQKDDFHMMVKDALLDVDSMLNTYATNSKGNSRFPAQTAQAVGVLAFFTLMIIVIIAIALSALVAMFWVLSAVLGVGLVAAGVVVAVVGVLLGVIVYLLFTADTNTVSPRLASRKKPDTLMELSNDFKLA